ncbi:MAG: hypothetical protein HXY18_12045 [Bryobacteraceae bacterium]|nr:hypothetical protein [Bryobacteraceae bacterium]
MGVKLRVPLRTQRASMECWYVAAYMVAQYRMEGPRLGLPDKWVPNWGIQPSDIARLAKAEGLKPIVLPPGNLTESQLETLLRTKGPLWCAGNWDGVGHAVVLTGVERGMVYINDPNPAKGTRVETVDWFNKKLFRWPDSLMYKAP